MSEQPAGQEIARLERIVDGEPAAPAFPALAEAHRRSGDAARAEQVARAGLAERPDHLAGRVALGLALLELGRTDEARAELERALEVIPDHVLAREAEDSLTQGDVHDAEAPLADAELEEAFAAARPEREAMIDAHELAEQAVRRVEHRIEPMASEPESPFATRTMAELLEKQGDPAGAAALREVVARRGAGGGRGGRREPAHYARVIRTLERWLERVSRRRP